MRYLVLIYRSTVCMYVYETFVIEEQWRKLEEGWGGRTLCYIRLSLTHTYVYITTNYRQRRREMIIVQLYYVYSFIYMYL